MINVLSLFDGMSCGQIAINKIGIKDYHYYASEIEKNAIQITQKNFPNTIQVGDITEIKYSRSRCLLECENISIGHLCKVDLLLGGSPCQGFSFAGKQLAFNDPRSKLFFEYVRILKEVKPRYFLLENVKMKQEFENVITETLFGITPIKINSNLLSAQNRQRLYWVGELQEDGTYKKVDIQFPQDKGIVIKDILDNEITPLDYYLTEGQKLRLKDFGASFSFGGKVNSIDGKASPILKSYYKAAGNGGHIQDEYGVRIFTETECERLQTVPVGYTEGVRSRARYAMLGNGWTVDVIAHILSYIRLGDI